MKDRIEKTIDLNAPVSRVWNAITDYEQFGSWFGVRLEQPFREGRVSTGRITIPGFDHITWNAKIVAVQPERYFAFRWHPYAIDPKVDYSKEEQTLVEFRLEEIPSGTRLVTIESGFDKVPEHRRAEAFRMNEGGWSSQIRNIEKYVTSK